LAARIGVAERSKLESTVSLFGNQAYTGASYMVQAILVWSTERIESGRQEIVFGGPRKVVLYKIKVDKQVIL
jgi:hypothetical protein